ncbi:hypothetical protein J3R83DRAFT_12229 [Lanmaoa asiatica]|nr:hypothetical protein J3R83DRAFT_12229 [Lanmaoa asiatica]
MAVRNPRSPSIKRRSSTFRPRNQHITKSPILTPEVYDSPLDTSSSGRRSFVELFEWTSTVDWVPWLSVTAALYFREWLIGKQPINEYTHGLALAGGARLANLLKTSVMDSGGNIRFLWRILTQLNDFDLMAEALSGVSAALTAHAGKQNVMAAPEGNQYVA